MHDIYSVEVDRYNPMALVRVLNEMERNIPDFEYDWTVSINAGGIDYGTFLNIDVDEKKIEICNCPEYGTDGDDALEDVFNAIRHDTEKEKE